MRRCDAARAELLDDDAERQRQQRIADRRAPAATCPAGRAGPAPTTGRPRRGPRRRRARARAPSRSDRRRRHRDHGRTGREQARAHTPTACAATTRRSSARSNSAGPNIAAKCSSTIASRRRPTARGTTPAISGSAAIIGSIARPASSVGHCCTSRHAPAGQAGSEQSNKPARQPAARRALRRAVLQQRPAASASADRRTRRGAAASAARRRGRPARARRTTRRAAAAAIGGAGAARCARRRLRTTPDASAVSAAQPSNASSQRRQAAAVRAGPQRECRQQRGRDQRRRRVPAGARGRRWPPLAAAPSASNHSATSAKPLPVLRREHQRETADADPARDQQRPGAARARALRRSATRGRSLRPPPRANVRRPLQRMAGGRA